MIDTGMKKLHMKINTVGVAVFSDPFKILTGITKHKIDKISSDVV